MEALAKKRQSFGYAEADPTADIEGSDAGRKAAIPNSHFIPELCSRDVYTERELQRFLQET